MGSQNRMGRLRGTLHRELRGKTLLDMTGFDYNLEHISNGEDALDRLMELDPDKGGDKELDLVLLDLGLPRMSGLKLLEAFYGARSREHRFRIAVLTGSMAPRDRQEVMSFRIQDYISKDSDEDELVSALRRIASEIQGVGQKPAV